VQVTTKIQQGGSTRTYEWPRPAVTADVAVFTVEGALDTLKLKVLLVERGADPFKGSWALPGGFVHEHEDLPAAAARELQEEAGLSNVYMEQVVAVGTPGRDPRAHTITVVYVALVPADHHTLQSAGDARAARWFDTARLPALAFDHGKLLGLALEHLRRRLGEKSVAFQLLPKEFTLSELQSLCEVILGRELDRRNFRRKLQGAGFVAPVKGKRQGAHRPAQLFRFLPREFERFTADRGALPF
jgi:8-oxo-dGTP diphosphatase